MLGEAHGTHPAPTLGSSGPQEQCLSELVARLGKKCGASRQDMGGDCGIARKGRGVALGLGQGKQSGVKGASFIRSWSRSPSKSTTLSYGLPLHASTCTPLHTHTLTCTHTPAHQSPPKTSDIPNLPQSHRFGVNLLYIGNRQRSMA